MNKSILTWVVSQAAKQHAYMSWTSMLLLVAYVKYLDSFKEVRDFIVFIFRLWDIVFRLVIQLSSETYIIYCIICLWVRIHQPLGFHGTTWFELHRYMSRHYHTNYDRDNIVISFHKFSRKPRIHSLVSTTETFLKI